MLKSTCRNLGHRAGKSSAAALGQNQAVGTEGFGTAHNRTKILGVSKTVYRHQQGRLANGCAAFHQGLQIKGLRSRCLQGDALVHGTTGELTQARPGDLLNQHARCLGLAQQLQKLGTKPHFWGAPDAVNRSTALQCRLGRVAAPDQIGAGIDAVAFRITARGQAIGVDDQRLGGEPARRGAAASTKTSAIRAPASFKAPAPFKATALGASGVGTAALGTTFKATPGSPLVGLAV